MHRGGDEDVTDVEVPKIKRTSLLQLVTNCVMARMWLCMIRFSRNFFLDSVFTNNVHTCHIAYM